MTLETYRLIHLVGIVLLFLGLGAVLAAGRGQGLPGQRVGMALHGLGLLALVVAGVGMLHKQQLEWQLWVWGKLGAWLVLAVLPFLVKRGKLPASVGWIVAIALGAAAVWLMIHRPV